MRITTENYKEAVFKTAQATEESMLKKGYTHVRTLFCDSSGLGSPTEPALTKEQLVAVVSDMLDKNPVMHTAITDVGQFQIYLSFYIKEKKHAA